LVTSDFSNKCPAGEITGSVGVTPEMAQNMARVVPCEPYARAKQAQYFVFRNETNELQAVEHTTLVRARDHDFDNSREIRRRGAAEVCRRAEAAALINHSPA
jgi:hypothetical protein